MGSLSHVVFAVISIILLYLFWRIGRVILLWAIKKYTSITIKTGRLGLFSLTGVDAVIRPGISMKISHAAFYSCYISSVYRKPLTLHCSNVRLEIDVEKVRDAKSPTESKVKPEGQTSKSTSRQERLQKLFLRIAKMITRFQYFGIQLSDVDILVVKGPIADSLFHVNISFANALSSINGDQGELILECDGMKYKWLKEEQQQTNCISEGGLTARARASIGAAAASVDLSIVLKKVTSNLSRDTPQRPLSISLEEASFSLGLPHGIHDLEMASGQVHCSAQGLLMTSQVANILSLKLLRTDLQIEQDKITFNGLSTGFFIGYQHEEVWPGIHVMLDGLQLKRRKREKEALKIPKKSSIAEWLSSKTLAVCLEMDHSSVEIATASCAGVKAGFVHLVVTGTSPSPMKSEKPREGDIRIETSTLYVKLSEGGVTYNELTPSLHHFNTVLYIATLLCKVKRTERYLDIDHVINASQVELSTHFLSVISGLVATISASVLTSRQLIMNRRNSLHAANNKSSHDNTTDGAFEESVFKETSEEKLLNTHKKSITREIKWNTHIAGVNLYMLCSEKKVYTVTRLDSINVLVQPKHLKMQMTEMKLVYEKLPTEQYCTIVRCEALATQVVHLPGIQLTRITKNSNHGCVVTNHLATIGEFETEWSMPLHMCIFTVVKEINQLKSIVQDLLPGKKMVAEKEIPKSQSSETLTTITMDKNFVLLMQLPKKHQVTFTFETMNVTSQKNIFKLTSPRLVIKCDGKHDVFTVKDLRFERLPVSERISLERANMSNLDLKANRVISVRMSALDIVFPFQYPFNQCYKALLSVNKWRKVVHGKKKKVDSPTSTLPPDLLIDIQEVSIELCDDPFEVRLGDNYQLMRDEHREHVTRIRTLESKLPDLSTKYGFLSASKLEALYSSLHKTSADVYVQRSRKLYTSSKMRTKVARYTLKKFEIIALADPTLHGRDVVLKHMREIDPSSPWPVAPVEYSTLFCRQVLVAAELFQFQLRDFPLPMFQITQLSLWGRFIGAEETGRPTARRQDVIQLEEPWDDVQVTKNMPTLKFYHDFSSDVEHWTMIYGPCWIPVFRAHNQCLSFLTKASVDPSPRMSYWDKIRLRLHGRLTVCCQKMSWLCHSSLDPYNTTELMDWTWTDLVLDWTNAKWIFKGDLDIFARTASKYDELRLLHLPNLRLCIKLDWLCNGNPDAHHLVQPTDPAQVPESELEGWDSYKDFRSQNLNMELSFEALQQSGDRAEGFGSDVPSCSLYSSTLRWLDHLKQSITTVARPIRRGKLWSPAKQRRKGLFRHYRTIRLSMNLSQFTVNYWVSHALQAGVEIQGHSLALLCALQLDLVSANDGLIRRPQSKWSVRQLGVEQHDVTVWLNALRTQAKQDENDLEVARNYFLSVGNVIYQRADEMDASMDSNSCDDHDRPQHRVQIHELKGRWSVSNRNIALSLVESYKRAQTLRKNLSTQALKPFRFDPQAQNPHTTPARVSAAPAGAPDVLTPSPASRLQSGPAHDLLQKLVDETETKFIAVHEQITEGNVIVQQLKGITACKQDDVIKRNWHVELYRSQVLLAGCEESGHVIVAAAKASILTSVHAPVWLEEELLSKESIVGSLDSMQYYATINPEISGKLDRSSSSFLSVDLPSQDNSSMTSSSRDEDAPIAWLSAEHIEAEEPEVEPGTGLSGLEGVLGAGHEVGGIVTEPADPSKRGGATVQLQRIISRCKCQFFFASYDELDDEEPVHVPLPLPVSSPRGGSVTSGRTAGSGGGGEDMVGGGGDEAVDTFTILHHDLNICTNSSQYLLMQDVVNNLLLHVDSKKREHAERQQRFKFKLHLHSVTDQKTPILQSQNALRELVEKQRGYEKQLYLLNKHRQKHPEEEDLAEEMQLIEKQLEESKAQIQKASEELAILIRAFKEMRLEEEAQLRAVTRSDDARVVKHYELCFKHAEWRMTEPDGQIGIADVKLSNFLYQKISKDDDSGSHQMELGYLQVTNLLPDSPYKETLGPREMSGAGLGVSDRQTMLRVLCKFKAPVGGIAIKEHFEVNVQPLSLQLTKRFYRTAMRFFFPERKKHNDSRPDEEGASGKTKKKRGSIAVGHMTLHVDDVDKMKERAAKNQMFLYVKIPEVPLTVSYKGLKDKNVTDVHNFELMVPTLEYHNQTWTYLDMLMAMKTDCKRVLISQAIKQKLHMRSRVAELVELAIPTDSQTKDQTMASMLLGTKLLGEKPRKKSLFSKTDKT